MSRVPGIFCLNTDCEHYFEDNCMKFLEKGTLNISKNGECEDFEHGEYEGYKNVDIKSGRQGNNGAKEI